MEPPSGFEHETPGLGIQWLNHYAIGLDTASGTILQKRCSRICGLNPTYTKILRVSKNLYAGNRTLFP